MLVLIDNYDSFTYNLFQYFLELKLKVKVFRNDKINLDKIRCLKPSALILSPGPGRPENAGICLNIIENFYKNVPILGICLGHQAIAYCFGGKIIKDKRPLHGKVSEIIHYKKGIYKDISNPFLATRYHSLIVDEKHLPLNFEITARTKNNNKIMGIKHKKYPLEGMQFHPESIETVEGKKMIKNFIKIYKIK